MHNHENIDEYRRHTDLHHTDLHRVDLHHPDLHHTTCITQT